MPEPSTPLPFTFQQLKQLAWARIPRDQDTAALYASEEQARECIGQAANELQRVFTSPDSERLVSSDDALALELVTILEHYGRSGAIAARIIVDRYGMNQE